MDGAIIIGAGYYNWCLPVHHSVVQKYNQTKMPSVLRRASMFSEAFVSKLVFLVIENSNPQTHHNFPGQAFLSPNGVWLLPASLRLWEHLLIRPEGYVAVLFLQWVSCANSFSSSRFCWKFLFQECASRCGERKWGTQATYCMNNQHASLIVT